MNVEIETKAAQFLFLEYINGNFSAVCKSATTATDTFVYNFSWSWKIVFSYM
jgi:hypothetical protein